MKNILLFITITCCSCTKYLDKKPDARQAIPGKLSDYQALLDDANRMNMRNTPGFLDGCADAHFLPATRISIMSDNERKAYSWNIPEYRGNEWATAYGVVFMGNFCIDGLEEIPITATNSDMWRNVKGSAHFFKAFMYLQLLWGHAKAYDASTAATDRGIVLRNGVDYTVPSVRTSIDEGYREVLRNAHEALANLPLRARNIFRPSKIAAYGLLARTFLSMRMYDSAYFYADRYLVERPALINFGTLQLNARVPFQRFDDTEIAFYTESVSSSLANNSPSQFLVDTLLVSSYGPGDLRRRAYFTPRSGYSAFKGSYTASQTTLFTGLATDEIYLIRAECHARAGRVADAMNDLNHLLQFRWDASFMPLTATNSAEALGLVLTERKKELLFRGIRWSDIKRLNLEGAGIVPTRVMDGQTYTLLPNDPRYAIRLPDDIIELTGIPQN